LMERTLLKQVLAADVAQKELVVCFAQKFSDLNVKLVAHKVFANSKEGFEKLIAWVNKLADPELNTHYFMEATGVYHEKFAYFLVSKSKTAHIVLPSKISHYAKTLEIK